jgi:hypothetical protein
VPQRTAEEEEGKSGETMKTIYIPVATTICLVVTVLYGCYKQPSKTDTTYTGLAGVPSYEIVKDEQDDTPLKAQVEIHAILNSPATEDQLRSLLGHLYGQAKVRKGFKFHNTPNAIYLYLYPSREHYDSPGPSWLAMLDYNANTGQVQPSITVREDAIKAQLVTPETKMGLSESARKEIFKELWCIETRSNLTSQRLFPMPDPKQSGYSSEQIRVMMRKQDDCFTRLKKEAEAELCQHYKVKEKELLDITVEGIHKNWPQPPRK